MFHLFMRDSTFDPSRVRWLRSGIIAGGPVSENVGRRRRASRDGEIVPGLAETGPTGVAVDVTVDFVTGQPHRPEGVAGLAVRGPDVALGVRMAVESRRSYTPARSVRTSDLGVTGADGCVRVVSRRRETILRGGHQIHPREAKDQPRAHSAVNDVCVIGVPHDMLGELVCARIVKVPDLARFAEALPSNGTGSVKRRVLERTSALETPPS